MELCLKVTHWRSQLATQTHLVCQWRTTSVVLPPRMRQMQKEKPANVYFMLVQSWAFQSPFFLQRYWRETQQINKLQDTGVWLTYPATWNHLCIPINAYIRLRYIKGFMRSLKAQQRLTIMLWNTFPALSDSGTWHKRQYFKYKRRCPSAQGFATLLCVDRESQTPKLRLFQVASSFCRTSHVFTKL